MYAREQGTRPSAAPASSRGGQGAPASSQPRRLLPRLPQAAAQWPGRGFTGGLGPPTPKSAARCSGVRANVGERRGAQRRLLRTGAHPHLSAPRFLSPLTRFSLAPVTCSLAPACWFAASCCVPLTTRPNDFSGGPTFCFDWFREHGPYTWRGAQQPVPGVEGERWAVCAEDVHRGRIAKPGARVKKRRTWPRHGDVGPENDLHVGSAGAVDVPERSLLPDALPPASPGAPTRLSPPQLPAVRLQGAWARGSGDSGCWATF